MSQTPDIAGLLAGAVDEGDLSVAGMQALDIPDMGAQIQAGMGITCDDVTASEVVLFSQLVDDSGSIRMGSNSQLVRDGHNLCLDALTASKQRNGILTQTRYLNGTVLNPFCLVESAQRMDARNFDPRGGTPLYDQTVVMLGTVLAKAQEFADQGVPVRTVTVIITDGADAGSYTSGPQDVAALVRDMLRAETHIVAGMGIDDGRTDFTQVFADMGIPPQWIRTPNNTPSEIRQAFELVSQSAVRASQGGANFSQTSLGGFGAP